DDLEKKRIFFERGGSACAAQPDNANPTVAPAVRRSISRRFMFVWLIAPSVPLEARDGEGNLFHSRNAIVDAAPEIPGRPRTRRAVARSIACAKSAPRQNQRLQASSATRA